MRVGIFNEVTGGKARFELYKEKYKNVLELIAFDCHATYENLDKIAENQCEALIYFNPKREDEAFFKKMSEQGIKYLSTTSTGYDHYNLEAMKKYGIKGANVPVYSPNSVAEHAVLLTLSVLRNYREQLLRIENGRYDIGGLMGKEIRNQVIGIVGTGRIGATTARCLSGFGPKNMLAYAHHENPALKELVTYVDLDTLYRTCDVILFHCSATAENYHMIDKNAIEKMKDGVILINTARGTIFDTPAIVEAVKSGKIGGLGLDVIEGEEKLRGGTSGQNCPIPELAELLQHYNVTFTQHTAFYTDEAYRNITETAIDNLLEYEKYGSCERELVKE